MLGSFGEVPFEVSIESVRTFDDMSITHGVNYASHNILNGPELIEYTGRKAKSISLTIELHEISGVNVEEEISRLREMIYNHEAQNFILGGNVIGEFVIESMTEKYNKIAHNGKILSASINLSLKEYTNEE